VQTLISSLNQPAAIDVNPAGDVFFSEDGGRSIAKLPANGTPVQWLVTGGSYGYVAAALDSQGNLFYSSYWDGKIYELANGSLSPTVIANLSGQGPRGIDVDASGNVFVAMFNYNEIVKISAAGNVSTVANGSALNQIESLAVDSAGNVYYDGAGAIFMVPAGTSNAQVFLANSSGSRLYVDSDDVLYFMDAAGANSTVGPTLTRLLPGCPSPEPIGRLPPDPQRLAVHAGAAYITFYSGGYIGKVDLPSAQPCQIATGLNQPAAIDVTPTGDVYFTQDGGQSLNIIRSSSAQVETLPSNGDYGYVAAAVDSHGDLYYSSYWDGKIYKYNNATNSSSLFATLGGQGPRGIDVDAQGNVFVAWSNYNKVLKILPDGTVTTIVTESGNVSVESVAVDSRGNVYFDFTNKIYRLLEGSTTPEVYIDGVSASRLYVDENDVLYYLDEAGANATTGSTLVRFAPGCLGPEALARLPTDWPQRIAVRNNTAYITFYSGGYIGKFRLQAPDLCPSFWGEIANFSLDAGSSVAGAVNASQYFGAGSAGPLTFSATAVGSSTGWNSTAAVMNGSWLSLSSSDPNWTGTLCMKIRGTDTLGRVADSNTFCVEIVNPPPPVNQAPVFSGSLPDLSLVAGSGVWSQVDAASHFGDPDGDPLSFALVPVPPSGGWNALELEVLGVSIQVRSPPGSSWVGRACALVRASDGEFAAESNTLCVDAIPPPNQPPAWIQPIPNMTLTAGVAASVFLDTSAYVTDPDGDSLALEAVLTSPDGWQRVSVAATGQMVAASSEAGSNWTGRVCLLLRASDGRATSDSNEFCIAVVAPPPPANSSPRFSGNIGDVMIVAGSDVWATVSLGTHFLDPDADALTFTIVNLFPGEAASHLQLGFQGSTTLEVRSPSGSSWTGAACFEVRATDPGGLIADSNFVCAIVTGSLTAGQDPTIVVPFADIEILAGSGNWTPVELAGHFVSPRGEPLVYSVVNQSQSSGWSQIGLRIQGTTLGIESPAWSSWTGQLCFAIRATNPEGLFADSETLCVAVAANPLVTPPATTPPQTTVEQPILTNGRIGLIGLGAAVALGAVAATTEVGLYFIVGGLLGLTLGRKRRESLLEHFVRGRLYQVIVENPGLHMAELRRRVDAGNGAAIHHLQLLEKGGYINVVVDGAKTRFYATDAPIAPESYALDKLDHAILTEVEQAPGISQAELCARLKKHKSTVSHHVNRLTSYGYVSATRNGNSVALYRKEHVEPAPLYRVEWPL
jgi:streptogramin lyase/DNA-binding transcriptional ArsR family regulator